MTTPDSPRPAMPDLSDLIENPGKPPKSSGGPRLPRSRMYAAAGAATVVLLGVGFAAGHVTAHSGPATLAAAVTEAQQGKLPCGTPAASTNSVGGTGGATGAESPGGGFGGGAGFIVARICQSSGARNATAGGAPGGGAGFGGRGGGGALGGLFGPGSVNGTVTSLSNGTLTLSTRGGDVTIALPDSAKVTKTGTGSLSDVGNGASVVVTTTQDASGNRTATSVFVLPATAASGQNG